MKKYLFLAILSVFALQSCEDDIDWVPDDYNTGDKVEALTPPSGDYEGDQSFKIVAYYSESRNPDSIDVKKYKMITHLNYAFLYPNADGSLKELGNPDRFKQVMETARANGIKTAISLAGSEGVYSALASNPGYRTKFVGNIVNFVLRNNLDGVDLDWEYPRANKANNITYTALVKELSDSLHVWHKFLSVAVTPAVYAGSVRDGITEESIQHVDFFNIMMYDGIGWDSEDPGQHSSYRMAEESLNIWINEKGLPKSKAVIGIPAYGKNSSNSALTYRDLLWKGANPSEDSFVVNGTTYYYNGVETVKRKAALAQTQANGLMVWEFYQDANGQHSLLKAINDKLGRPY
ncbi:glycosyl hydrolase family 18 protein [Pontibacter locisalis]|uniref:chitinase n=1 Tax=Pontibacter locisalis TaxID=1719035 RepID=A0ABW5IKA6_9BACT